MTIHWIKTTVCLAAVGTVLQATAVLADSAAECKTEKNLDKKIAACTEVIAKAAGAPRDLSMAHVWRGTAYHDKKDYDGAIKEYETALALVPKMSEALGERGMTRTEKKDFIGAIEDHNLAIANKTSPNTFNYYQRGKAYQGAGDTTRAAADYRRALELDPKNATARERLAALEGGKPAVPVVAAPTAPVAPKPPAPVAATPPAPVQPKAAEAAKPAAPAAAQRDPLPTSSNATNGTT